MATRTLEIDLRQGTGASSEPMYGVVTVQRAKAKSAGGFEILPFETSLKLINGKATIIEAETDGTGPFYDSAYLFRVQNGYCAPRWGFMAALPDGTTPITTGELPKVDPITGEGIYMDAQEWNALYGDLPNRVSGLEVRVETLEALGGLSPESPIDGQTANLIEQDGTLTAAAIDARISAQGGSASVTSGEVVGDNLILSRSDGVEIDAGNVRGLPGQDGTDGAIRMLSSFGVVGDGVADDTAAVNAALEYAATTGETVLTDRTFTAMAMLGTVRVPEGVCFDANSIPLHWNAPAGLHMFSMSSNSSLKNVNAVCDTSTSTNQRGVSIYQKTNVSLENVSISSTLPGAGAGNQYRTALNIEGSSKVTVENFSVKNFDFSINLISSKQVFLDGIDVSTYQRGIYLSDVTDSRISNADIYGSSPNSSASPGHNGVLIGASGHRLVNNVLLDNVIVRDSGEHGFRIGGNKITSNVEFRTCKAINVGRCGFKVLGGEVADNNYHEDIDFINCKVVDAGNVEINAAGFMVQFVKRVNIVNPVIIKKDKTYSVGIGIEIQAIDGLQIINPYIHSTLVSGISLSPVLGDFTEISIIGGYIFSGTGNGLTINYSIRTIRRFRMSGYPEINIGGSGYGVSIKNTTGTVVGRSFISFYSTNGSAQLIDPTSNTSGFSCDVRANFPTTDISSYFSNGSVWWDTSTTGAEPRYKIAGAWRKPSYAAL